jgi:hypothetical protein
MQMDAVASLEEYGDPYEKEGVINYQLGDTFPRYATFWHTYVLPNRDSADPSKLRLGFPQTLEAMFGTHYSVWYHLTIAYRQILDLDDYPAYVQDPFYHLGSAIDMAEQTIAMVLVEKERLNSNEPVQPLSNKDILRKTAKFCSDYPKYFKAFSNRRKPVGVPLHSIKGLLIDLFPEQDNEILTKFDGETGKVRHYRNVITHNPILLNITKNGVIFLPKEKHLHKYDKPLWSSLIREDLIQKDFSRAETILLDLTSDLVVEINSLWKVLLEQFKQIISSENYNKWFSVHPQEDIPTYEPSGTFVQPSGVYAPFDEPVDSSAATRIYSTYVGSDRDGGSANWYPESKLVPILQPDSSTGFTVIDSFESESQSDKLRKITFWQRIAKFVRRLLVAVDLLPTPPDEKRAEVDIHIDL